MSTNKITTRKTPNGRHLYKATCKGYGCYGWGNTPADARAKLAENMAEEDDARAWRQTCEGQKRAEANLSY